MHTYHECSSLFEVILLGPLAGCVGSLCSSSGRGFSVAHLPAKGWTNKVPPHDPMAKTKLPQTRASSFSSATCLGNQSQADIARAAERVRSDHQMTGTTVPPKPGN